MSVELPSYRARFVHLTAVWAFAVGQPVFFLLQGNPEFLAVRGLTRAEVALFATAIAVAPPLFAVACEWLVSKTSPWLANMLHVFVMFVFLIPVGLQIAKRVDPTTPGMALLIVCAVAMVGAVTYIAWRPGRLFLAFSFALPIIGLVWFVTSVPAATAEATAATLRPASRPPIVMVVLDELPVSSLMTTRGSIDAVRYPHFAQLSRDGTWYRDATTVHDFTTAAVPAILTGRMSDAGALPTYADHPQNLFMLLGAAYELNVQEVVTRLCPLSMCPQENRSILWSGEDLYEDLGIALLHRVTPHSLLAPVPPISTGHRDDAFDAFISEIAARARPGLLHFLHVLLPHSPWRFLPSGHTYGFYESVEGQSPPDGTWIGPRFAQQAYQRHLLQLGYTDALLGRLLRQLKSSGLYHSALVIVVADHGSSFRPGGSQRVVDHANLADIAAVPMIIKYPHQRQGGVDTRPARTVDIVPTVADVLRIRPPWTIDGHSLLGEPSQRTHVAVESDRGAVRASLEDVRRDVEGAVKRKAALFGEGTGSLYQIGRERQCLGSRIPTKLPRSTTVRVHIEDAESLAWVRLASRLLPTRISGFVAEGTIANTSELAISVNGQVVALARPFRTSDGQWFRVLVPEQALREGYNRVDVLEIEDCSDRRFVSLGGVPDQWR